MHARAVLHLLALALLAGALLHVAARDAEAGGEMFCVDFYPTMDPLAFGGGCYEATEPGEVLVVGRAIVGDHYAPIDTTISGWIEDIGCGVAPMGFRTFELVLAGCDFFGDSVHFDIGTERAAEMITWPQVTTFPIFQSLTAMDEHAWYWSERIVARPPAIGTPVQAVVGGAVCGETTIDVVPRGFVIHLEELRGFWKLVVPSAGLSPGCGAGGALVSFVVNGAHALTAVPWAPGVQQIDLTLAGDPNCDLVAGATDAALVLQLQAGLLRSTLQCEDGADVNGDGSANAVDATVILQFAAGLLAELAVPAG